MNLICIENAHSSKGSSIKSLNIGEGLCLKGNIYRAYGFSSECYIIELTHNGQHGIFLKKYFMEVEEHIQNQIKEVLS